MARRRGFSLIELLVVVAAIVLLLFYFRAAGTQRHGDAIRIRCRNNLHQLAKGMATYVNELGNNTWLPCPLGRGSLPNDYNGAEWLASLYWTGVVPDPNVFLCPSVPDTNNNGRDLGSHSAASTFGSQTVSYAALHWRSLADTRGNAVPSALKDDFPPSEPMACDDTEGSINHGERTNGGMAILFFDSHVEFKTNTDLDLERSVGRKPGLLWRLRN